MLAIAYDLIYEKVFLIILPIIAISLELLPSGTVLIFAPSATDRIIETFSYFSLVPFGYANFGPFITAIITCVVLLLAIVSLIKKDINKYLFLSSLIGILFSLLPLMYGVDYITYIGIAITLLLTIECAISRSLL